VRDLMCHPSLVRRGVLLTLAVLCDLTGAIWVLQGTGVLPGSFMSGDILWAAIGVVLWLVSGVLLWVALRPRLS